MIQKLKNKLESLHLYISPTITNKNQFETNVKNEFMCEHLRRNIEMLEKHFNYIGKEVYQYSKNKSVTMIDDFKSKENEELTHSLFFILKETAEINNFWTDKASERKRIEGMIEDEIRYSKVAELSPKASELAGELMKLAKNWEADLK